MQKASEKWVNLTSSSVSSQVLLKTSLSRSYGVQNAFIVVWVCTSSLLSYERIYLDSWFICFYHKSLNSMCVWFASQTKEATFAILDEYCTLHMTVVQVRNEVKWRLGQETSLTPPFSNLSSSEANVLYWRKYLLHFWTFWCPPLWLGALRSDSEPP